MKIQINKYKKSDGTIPNYFDPALANQSQNPLIDKIIFNTYYKSGFSQYDEEFTQSDNLNIHKRSDFTVTFSLQQPERSTLGKRIDDFLHDTAKFVCAIDFDVAKSTGNKQLTGIINLDTVYTDYDTLEVQFNCIDWVVEFANYCKSIGVMQTDFVPITPPITSDSFPRKSFSEFINKQFRGNVTYGSIPFHFIGVTNNLHLERAFGTDPIISSPLLWNILNSNPFISRWEMFTEIMKGLGVSYRLNRVAEPNMNPIWFYSTLELFFKMDDNEISSIDLLRDNYKSGLSILGTKNWCALFTEIGNHTDQTGVNSTLNRGIIFNKNIYAIIDDNWLIHEEVKSEPDEYLNNKFWWFSNIPNVFFIQNTPPPWPPNTLLPTCYNQSDVFDIGLKIYKSNIIEQYFSEIDNGVKTIDDLAMVRILVQNFIVGTNGLIVNQYNDSNFMKLLQTFTMPNYMYYVIGVKEVLSWKVRFPKDSNLAIFNTFIKQDNNKKYFVNKIRNIDLLAQDCEVELIEK